MSLVHRRTQDNNEYEICSIRGMSLRGYRCKKIQFILDLDNGTLSLYKSAEEVYTIASGLEGEYIWKASTAGESQNGSEYELRIGDW